MNNMKINCHLDYYKMHYCHAQLINNLSYNEIYHIIINII